MPENRYESIWTVVENSEDYRPGGLHPVHLGDTFMQGTYKVHRKLGHGSASTVWMVEEEKCVRPLQRQYTSHTDAVRTAEYRALKIIASKESQAMQELDAYYILQKSQGNEGKQFILQLLDHFFHEGPNGRHLCIVYELMSDSLNSHINTASFDSKQPQMTYQAMKTITKQATQALMCLHRHGLVHNDVQPGNVLFVNDIAKPTMSDTTAGHPPGEDIVPLFPLGDRDRDSHGRVHLVLASPISRPDLEVSSASSHALVKLSDFGGCKQ